MGVIDFNDLQRHVGHHIVCVQYGDPAQNVAIECHSCNEVLLEFDRKQHRIPRQ